MVNNAKSFVNMPEKKWVYNVEICDFSKRLPYNSSQTMKNPPVIT